jgi:hypothetical protein
MHTVDGKPLSLLLAVCQEYSQCDEVPKSERQTNNIVLQICFCTLPMISIWRNRKYHELVGAGQVVVVVFCTTVRARTGPSTSRPSLLQEGQENQMATSTSPRSGFHVSWPYAQVAGVATADHDVPPHDSSPGGALLCFFLGWAGRLV